MKHAQKYVGNKIFFFKLFFFSFKKGCYYVSIRAPTTAKKRFQVYLETTEVTMSENII